MNRSQFSRIALVLFLVAYIPQLAVAQRAQVQSPHGMLPEGLSCNACHSAAAWTPLRSDVTFDHGTMTAFSITGVHRSAECIACHEELRFDGLDGAGVTCASCHTDVHLGSMTQACTTCHSTESFTDVDGILIHARSNFPLSGAHVITACESCHSDDRGGAYSVQDFSCLGCHEDDYGRSTTLDHRARNFSTDCATCHNDFSWRYATFAHGPESSGYELIGAHAMLVCEACHTTPDLGLLFMPASEGDCFTCHAADYQRAHRNGSKPTTCAFCHSNNSWEGAGKFDHAGLSGGFDLVGKHGALDCSSCHSEPDMVPLFRPASQQDCYTCHASDYESAHAGSAFPTTCVTCHNENGWDASAEDHDRAFFPIYSGRHRGTWDSCQTCHTNPSEFGLFTCIDCHEHSQSRMDEQHRTRADYVWESTACYSCHPDGRGDD